MGTIITATGRMFDSDYFVILESQSLLFLRVLNVDENTVREVFGNSAETSCLRSGDRVAFGYINLQSIFKEGNAFKVVLSR